MSDQPGRSKRQRMFEFVKATKDVYIPTISNTISQLASEATSRALNYSDDGTSQINTDVTGAQIILYPHFTRSNEDNTMFFTQVHGWVYTTEGSSRKKKIIFTLAKQLAKSNNTAVSDIALSQMDEQMQQGYDDDSLSSSSSDPLGTGTIRPLRRTGTSSSTRSDHSLASSTSSTTDDVLKERIANFVNRSLGNTELTIAVGGRGQEELQTVDLLTDANGNFNIDVETPFKPSFIQVAIARDEKIFVLHDPLFPGDCDYAIISDIDDTIKRTGVCGDKRSVFRNVFADNMESWEIPGAADCYRFLAQKFDMPFFYVSNSPYQLYSNLVKFFELFEFPQGSMYLKKYSGNVLTSLTEPLHARKKAPLERIFDHFSDKKFFLIGDTSEQDLEAYVDVARLHPDKVAGIYIRVAEGSMSTETFKMLVDMMNKRSTPLAETTNDMHEKFEHLQTSEQNLIDLDDTPTPGIPDDHMAKLMHESKMKSQKVTEGDEDLEQGLEDAFFAKTQQSIPQTTSRDLPVKKAPPKVPSKPNALKSTSIQTPKSAGAPPLPRRPVPPLPKSASAAASARSRQIDSVPPSFSSNNVALTDEESEEWISRLLTSLLILRKAGDIKLKLFCEFNEVQEDIYKQLKDLPKKKST